MRLAASRLILRVNTPWGGVSCCQNQVGVFVPPGNAAAMHFHLGEARFYGCRTYLAKGMTYLGNLFGVVGRG
jgi:hypothetical protein